MLHFDCDYMAGAHPAVLQALARENAAQHVGYGYDDLCQRARQLIRQACCLPEAAVHFMMGGTQTNATVIGALLRPTEGIIATDTAHISVHEAGAIEMGGHKVITIDGHDGKLAAEDVVRLMADYHGDETHPHIVRPAAVYISYPTELGTLYTRDELSALYAVCQRHQLPLYIDGARLTYGLAASRDLTLPTLARCCDLFYIGGTKAGALFGEALVCRDATRLPYFFSTMKAHGAVLAKGWLLGVQFKTLMTDDLLLRIGREAVRQALRLADAFRAHGYAPFIDSPTNQQFFCLPNALIDRLHTQATFDYWGVRGATESRVRFVTSWETTEADIDALAALL